MKKYAIIATIVLSSTISATGQEKGAEEVWKSCVAEKVERYSRGPDAAELIVDVALDACSKERNAFLDQISKDRSKTGRPQDVVSHIELVMRGELLVKILELRSQK